MAVDITSNWLAFQDTIEDLENIDIALQQFATKIVDDMRRDVPKDTGDLKKSIKVQTDRFGFRLQMLEYGFYQNYGVGPKPRTLNNTTNSPTAPVNPYGVTEPLAFGDYQYSNRKFGLAARPFFDLADIQTRLIELVEQQIEE